MALTHGYYELEKTDIRLNLLLDEKDCRTHIYSKIKKITKELKIPQIMGFIK
jgi:hypothetical protein